MWGSKTRGQAGPVFSSYKTHTIFPCSSLCRIRKDLLSRMPSEVGRCNFLVSCVRARSSAITTLQSGFFAKGGGVRSRGIASSSSASASLETMVYRYPVCRRCSPQWPLRRMRFLTCRLGSNRLVVSEPIPQMPEL